MYKNYTNYEVFEDCKIWSKVRKKFLKPYKQKNGYLYVNLYDNNGKLHCVRLHKVVYFAVNNLWEYPEGYEINHKDENKENNHISNLELVTRKENVNWGTAIERSAAALSKTLKGKIPVANPPKRVAAYNAYGELVMVFDSTREAGRNGYNSGHVSRCCLGKLKTHKGYTWRFLDEESETN